MTENYTPNYYYNLFSKKVIYNREKFCGYCGIKLKIDTNICPYCGSSV